jgi:hypothetical protein
MHVPGVPSEQKAQNLEMRLFGVAAICDYNDFGILAIPFSVQAFIVFILVKMWIYKRDQPVHKRFQDTGDIIHIDGSGIHDHIGGYQLSPQGFHVILDNALPGVAGPAKETPIAMLYIFLSEEYCLSHCPGVISSLQERLHHCVSIPFFRPGAAVKNRDLHIRQFFSS